MHATTTTTRHKLYKNHQNLRDQEGYGWYTVTRQVYYPASSEKKTREAVQDPVKKNETKTVQNVQEQLVISGDKQVIFFLEP